MRTMHRLTITTPAPVNAIGLSAFALVALLLVACTTSDAPPVADTLGAAAPAPMLDAVPGSGLPDTMPATAVADFVVAAIDDMRWSDLAALAHPDHGIRFAPYGYVDTADTQQMLPDEVALLGEDLMIRHWGTADGTGDSMDFTFAEYYSGHLYSREFRDARQGAPGEIIEREMMRREPQAIRADVVLAGHHGSRTSSDPTFVNATGASHSLVSAGYGNRFGHPHEQVEYRWTRAGAEVLSTATGGALRVRLGEGGTTVEQRRLAHPRLWDAQRRLAVDETLQERQ